MTDMEVPQLRNVLERAGRTAIDSELTSKILELRLARAGSRDGKWPATLEDDASRACPGDRYAYRRTGSSIEIAFQGKPPSSESGLSLPLSFSTRADRRAVAPTGLADARSHRDSSALELTSAHPCWKISRAYEDSLGSVVVVAGGDPVGRIAPCRIRSGGAKPETAEWNPRPGRARGFSF